MDHVTDFAQSLQADSLIKIYVGEDPERRPYLIPKSTLEHTAEYFKKALQHAPNFGTDNPEVLRFPEDNRDAWGVFLYWMCKRVLPDRDILFPKYHGEKQEGESYYSNDDTPAIRCWSLGDKYGIHDFQNELMVNIIVSLSGKNMRLDAMREAFESTAPASKLRELCMIELALEVQSKNVGYGKLEKFDGITGFTSALLTTMHADHAEKRYHGCFGTRCLVEGHVDDDDCDECKDNWKLYLVGENSSTHQLEAEIKDAFEYWDHQEH